MSEQCEHAQPVVSVIVPVYNGAQDLPTQFERMVDQDFSQPWELIYVDNGSRDGSRELIKQFQAPPHVRLRLVDFTAVQGQAAARNHGAAVASCEQLCFTDQDDLPSHGWLRELYAVLAERQAVGGWVKIGKAGCRPNLDGSALGEPSPALPRLFGRFPIAYGTNFGIHRSLLNAVAGWQDIRPEVHAGEDTDLCIRLALRGVEIAYAPQAKVVWRPKLSMGAAWRQGIAYGRSEVLNYARHRAAGLQSRGWKGAFQTWIYAFGRFLWWVRPRNHHNWVSATHGLAWAVGRTFQSVASRVTYI
jgi:GT2 family glycosyltransferase